MKNLIRLSVFACLLLMQGETLWAQAMPFSQMVRHNNIKGKEVITRALPESSVLTCTKSVDNSGKHTFVLYSPTDGSTQYFTCNLGALFSSSLDDYSIKDMYIFEKKCYFCDSVTHRELIIRCNCRWR